MRRMARAARADLLEHRAAIEQLCFRIVQGHEGQVLLALPAQRIGAEVEPPLRQVGHRRHAEKVLEPIGQRRA